MHTDKPTSTKSEDRFQRYKFSKRIASIIAKPKIDKSLIVGLYGKWGEGKTSVMFCAARASARSHNRKLQSLGVFR